MKIKIGHVYNTPHSDDAIVISKIEKNLDRVQIKYYTPEIQNQKHYIDGYFKLSLVKQLQLELDVIKTLKYRKIRGFTNG